VCLGTAGRVCGGIEALQGECNRRKTATLRLTALKVRILFVEVDFLYELVGIKPHIGGRGLGFTRFIKGGGSDARWSTGGGVGSLVLGNKARSLKKGEKAR